jgi:hypothetical protein
MPALGHVQGELVCEYDEKDCVYTFVCRRSGGKRTTDCFHLSGRLNNGGTPANGSYDFQFAAYDAVTNGDIVGGPITATGTTVSNGLFTVQLDFGAGVFTGAQLWLDIAVRNNGDPYAILGPRQPITSTPYAIQSANAANAANATVAASANSVSAANITGTITTAQLPTSVVLTNGNGVNLAGAFSGNGNGLTNLNLGAINGLTTGFSALRTNKYTNFGTYTITVPANVTRMRVKLWGAAGGFQLQQATAYPGGGGAYVMTTLPVSPGETYVAVVGRGGGGCPVCAGGVGDNDASGGIGNTNAYSITGGQGSSFFKLANGRCFMKAVAGGGGAGGIFIAGAGGNPGQDAQGGGRGGANGFGGSGYSSGYNYSTNALTIGETNLNLMNGDGGNGQSSTLVYSGGGGGYGGGGGSFNCGAGGGSYGDVVIGGNHEGAGNTNDADYVFPAGMGVYGNGSDGLIVVAFDSPSTALLGNLQVNGFFSGDASGLTNVPIPTNVARLNSNQTFTAQNTFGGSSQTYFNGIFARGGAPGANGSGNNGYAFWNGGDMDSGMFSQGDGQLDFYINSGLMESMDGTGVAVNGAITSKTGNGFFTIDRANSSDQWAVYAVANRLRFWNQSVNGDQVTIDKDGTLRSRGPIFASTSPDIAETIATASDVEVGDVVCADPEHPESVIRCSKENRGVLGVISDGTGGFLINAHGNSVDATLTGKPLVLAGRVPVKVSLANGPVKIGDTLAPSSVPGVAMRSDGTGATVGIALESFEGDGKRQTGHVLCFVKVAEAKNDSAKDAQIRCLEERVRLLEQKLEKVLH